MTIAHDSLHLIIGTAGGIGSALARQLAPSGGSASRRTWPE